MYIIETRFKSTLKSIAFVCSRLNDGLTQDQIFEYLHLNDEYDREFLAFCIEFSVENKWLVRKNDGDRYSLTILGREFISSQFG